MNLRLPSLAVAVMLVAACKGNHAPEKPVVPIDYSNPEALCNEAYRALGDCWVTYPFNLWPYGDVASDNALKGGWFIEDAGYHPIEIWSTLSSTDCGHCEELWNNLYKSVVKCNHALIALDGYGVEKLGGETAAQRVAEMKFLRAHFYYKLVQIFYRVPWCDEKVVLDDAVDSIGNDLMHGEIMLKIVDDFKEACQGLPAVGDDPFRATKAAASGYLAKCYLDMAYGDGYEATTGYAHISKEYMAKVLEYTENATFDRYGLLGDFGDVFLPENRNSKESIFAVQVTDNTESCPVAWHSNLNSMANGCWGIWSYGKDLHKPSQNLVNAFKTEEGLPSDKYENVHNSYPVLGGPSDTKFDPRLFHTVGMPTYPYKYEADVIMTVNNSRNPSTYGYYTSLKEIPQRGKGEASVGGLWQSFAMNEYVIRYADVQLMRAEALIEMGDLDGAQKIINILRQRSKNSVGKHISYAADRCDIALHSRFSTQDDARKALRWERRLELAMEGSRFFDLRRWGMASATLTGYFEVEVNDRYEGQDYAKYLKDAKFQPGKNEYWPIPAGVLEKNPAIEQNTGY